MLEKNNFYKDKIHSMRSQIRDLFINDRSLTSRDIHYKSLKWKYSCTISQNDYWIKDIITDKNGKLVHLKFMDDDIIPSKKKHIWARLHDEINQ